MSDRPSYIPPKRVEAGDIAPESEEAELARKLMDLKEKKAELAVTEKETNKAIDDIETKLAAVMEARGINLFRVKDLGTFSTSVVNYASCNDQETFAKWLDENGMGAISKRSVHPSTLKGWVNDRLKNAQPIPDCVNNFPKTRINTRKA